MGFLYDDVVVITEAENPGGQTVITVNCPDKTGLGCDLCRIILLFGLSIARGDLLTDGKWCYIVLWVVGRKNLSTRWNLLKKRLLEVCPPCLSASGICYYHPEIPPPTPPNVFLLKFWCSYHRKGLLHDVTEVLCELELTIKRVKVSTTPDGRVVDLFFITDTRELLHTKQRQGDTINRLKSVIRDALISCEIVLASLDVTASQGSLFLPSDIMDNIFSLELSNEHHSGSLDSSRVSIVIENSLSRGHTLLQILCQDHKGLMYDIMRTLKDYNIQTPSIAVARKLIETYALSQTSYGRFFEKSNGNCELDLFVVQSDGRKIVDPNKQNALCSRLRMELLCPLRLTVVSRGPETELLVVNPVEFCGRGRPLVFHDITLALKTLDIDIFLVDIGRRVFQDREWEVYRILLDEGNGFPVPRSKVEECVRKELMGWE